MVYNRGKIRLTTVILMVHNQMTTATQLTLKELFFLRKKSLATKKAIPCMTSVLVYVSIHGSIVKNWINLAKSKPGLEEILTEFQRKINKEKNFYCWNLIFTLYAHSLSDSHSSTLKSIKTSFLPHLVIFWQTST